MRSPIKLGYFRWLDVKVLNKIGTMIITFNLINYYIIGLSSNVKVVRTDKSIYCIYGKYQLPSSI